MAKARKTTAEELSGREKCRELRTSVICTPMPIPWVGAKFIYANDLAELREKEKKLIKDQLDGLDLYVAGKATVNDTFDRYLSTKFKLRETTLQQLHLYV